MPRNRLLRAAPLAALLLAVLVPVAFAATVEQGTTYTLAQGQVVNDDLYVFAQTVTIAGHVYGDVIAAGTKVEVAPSGVVDGDLMAAGQDVLVEGSVGDDVRAAAYTVEVRDGAHVGGDLLGAGFNVSIAQGATVTRDVVAAGSQGIVDGMVGRNLKFAGSGLEVTGSVDGDVEAVVSGGAEGEAPPMALFPMLPPPPRTVAPGLIIADTARIGGDLRYTSPAEVAVPAGVVAGQTVYNTAPVAKGKEVQERTGGQHFAGWLVRLVGDYIALIVVGAIVFLAWPRLATLLTSWMAEHPAPSFGWGCLTAIVAAVLAVAVPLVAVAASIFFGLIRLGSLAKPALAFGLLSAVLLTVGVYLLTWAGTVLVGTWTGRAILGRLAPGSARGRWAPMLLGLAVVAILINLPFIGFLLKVIIAALGLGAIVAWAWRGRWGSPPEPPPVEAVPAA